MHLASVLFITLIHPCADGDEARAVIEKAIKAHGGAQNLAKMRCMKLKGEGVYPPLLEGDIEFKFRFEDTFNSPKQLKRVIELVSEDFPLKYTMVLNGDAAWVKSGEAVEELKEDRLAEMHEQNHAHCADHLIHLLDKPYVLSKIDDIKLDGGAAVGVKVECKGRREVKLYFDKKTGLLVKREHPSMSLLDFENKVVLQEDFFTDFKEFDGLKHWTRMVTHHAGKKTSDAKVTELKFFEKIDGKEFAKP